MIAERQCTPMPAGFRPFAEFWEDKERTAKIRVYVGNIIRIYRIPDDPQPDFENYYDAEIADIKKADEDVVLFLKNVVYYNKDEKFVETETLNLATHNLSHIKVWNGAKKNALAPLVTARSLMTKK